MTQNAAQANSYWCYGLVIKSDIMIPGGVPLTAEENVAADVIIEIGLAEQIVPDMADGPYARQGRRMAFEVPGVARYLSTNGQYMTVEPARGADLTDIEDFLVATALPMLIWMRDGFVLHSGAVVMLGHAAAIAIAGPSGAGKSTLIAALADCGARVVGDDTVSVELNDTVHISGLAANIFMRQPDSQVRATRVVLPQYCIKKAQLGALVVIDTHDDTPDPSLTRLTGVAALQTLLQNRHRPRIPALLAREKAAFELCLLLCARLPIYRLGRSEGDVQSALDTITALSQSIEREGNNHG